MHVNLIRALVLPAVNVTLSCRIFLEGVEQNQQHRWGACTSWGRQDGTGRSGRECFKQSRQAGVTQLQWIQARFPL